MIEVKVEDKHSVGSDEYYGEWYRCPNCDEGKEYEGAIKEGDNFCPNCGAKIKWNLIPLKEKLDKEINAHPSPMEK